jgi:serine protease
MRLRRPLLLRSLLAPLACLLGMSLGTPAQAQFEQRARVIVKYRGGATALAFTGAGTVATDTHQRMRNLALRSGMDLRTGRRLSGLSHVVTTEGMNSRQLAEQLARQPDVEYAVVDGLVRIQAVPNDPSYISVPVSGGAGGPVSGQWYLRAPTSGIASSINIEPAWAITQGSPSVVVAVLDSGIRFDHPDFRRVADGGNLLDGWDFVSDDFRSNDGTPGRDADASDPGDWVTATDLGTLGSCSGARVSDSSWHGTKTAGLIAAVANNGVGMAGVGRNVRVLPVRVLGKCAAFESDLIAGARWAAGLNVPGVPDNTTPARIVNISLGDRGACPQSFRDAFTEITQSGTIVIASGGNSVGHAVGTPANCPGVLAVAGLRHVGTKVGFSDLGPEITLSAPGGNCVNDASQACLYPILTTTNAGTTVPVPGGTYTDSFNNLSVGTSFSAPLVAGTAALMLSVNPRLTAADVKAQLQQSARPFPTSGAETSGSGTVPRCQPPNAANQAQYDQMECYCTTATCGAGMLDVGAAVQLASNSFLPRIGVTPAAPQATQAITLSAAGSVLPNGRSIRRYQWAVVDGGGIVSAIASGADADSATLVPSGEGRFTVRLTLTDDQNLTATSTLGIEVGPAPSNSDDGGGALQAGPLWGLLAAVLALLADRLRYHRRVIGE